VSALLIVAGLLSIPGVFESLGGVWVLIARLVVLGAAGYGIYSQVHGPTVAEHRSRLRDVVARVVRTRLFGLPAGYGAALPEHDRPKQLPPSGEAQ
jgi:hypothetical protein